MTPAPGSGGVAAGLAAAVRFLTVVPMGSRERPGGLSWAATFFPLVGLGVGVAVALVLMLPLPPVPRAALALVAWIALTGGLHEDGWMDVMDAAFVPGTPSDRLEVLRDPRIGAHGATGGGAVLLLRFAALTAVPPVAAIVAAVLARWGMAVALAAAPPARDRGLGASLAAHPRAGSATVVAVALLAGLGGQAGWAPLFGAVLASAGAAGLWGWFFARRFGGLTGDGYGAVGYVAEVVALLAFIPLVAGSA